MIYYVHITDGMIVNRIVADDPLPPEWFPKGEVWARDDNAQIGWSYNGETFVPPPPAPEPEPDPNAKRLVAKYLITERLRAAGLIEAAYGALTQNPDAFARWFVPGKDAIYFDDPDAVALLTAIGADVEAILAE